MSDLILTLKLVHVLGAAVLFGTGAGIAFFMLMAHRTRDAATIAATARRRGHCRLCFHRQCGRRAAADRRGAGLEHRLLAIRALDRAVACALRAGRAVLAAGDLDPDRMRDIATAAARQGSALPPQYFSLFRIWFVLGWPAFFGVIAIFALMIWKPQLG